MGVWELWHRTVQRFAVGPGGRENLHKQPQEPWHAFGEVCSFPQSQAEITNPRRLWLSLPQVVFL